MNSDFHSESVLSLEERGALKVEDGNHGEYRPRKNEFVVSGTSFIRAADIKEGNVVFNGAECINDTALGRIRKGIGRPGDVLITHKGTIGRVGLVGDNSPSFVCSPQTTFWRVTDSSILDRDFLYAYMRSSQFQSLFRVYGGETDMAPYVSLTSQRSLVLSFPDIDTQRSIGRVVRSFDKKIELNRKTNETLEGIAKALFKSWFVDFDPVRAKAEGRPTGLPAEISDLFPDSFEESELGEIPSGWEFKQLGSVADVIDPHPSHRAPEAIEEGYPFAGIGDIDAMGNISIHKARVVGEETIREQEESFSINNRTIGFGRVGTVGKVVRLRNQDFRYALSPTLAVVNPQKCFASACYLLLGSTTFQNTVFSQMTGSTRPAIGIKVLRKLSSPFPSCDQPQILKSFEGLCAPLLAKGDILNSEIQLLTSLRDALLPRLISGELRVPDAEKMLEEVGI